MKEKILAAIQTKFPGVEVAILSRIAEKKASGVTDESQIPTIVEGISFQDVLTSYGDFRAGDATTSAVRNYEKKHNLKDGKPVAPEDPKPDPKPQEKTDDVPAWAQSLIDSNKVLAEKLAGYEAEKAKQERFAQILSKAKEYGIPENLVPMLNVADDADLDVYMNEAKQTFANLGFKGALPPDTAEQKMEKESEAIAKMINDGTQKIVEQQNK